MTDRERLEDTLETIGIPFSISHGPDCGFNYTIGADSGGWEGRTTIEFDKEGEYVNV